MNAASGPVGPPDRNDGFLIRGDSSKRSGQRGSGLASAPAIVIMFPLEGRPLVLASCLHEGDERRLSDWLASRASYRRLVDEARRLAGEECAA